MVADNLDIFDEIAQTKGNLHAKRTQLNNILVNPTLKVEAPLLRKRMIRKQKNGLLTPERPAI